MDGVAAHAFGPGDEFQVVDDDVLLVVVLEADAMAGWDGADVFFPEQDVNALPVPGGIAGILDLSLQVAIGTYPCAADREPCVGLLPLLELRFR